MTIVIMHVVNIAAWPVNTSYANNRPVMKIRVPGAVSTTVTNVIFRNSLYAQIEVIVQRSDIYVSVTPT